MPAVLVFMASSLLEPTAAPTYSHWILKAFKLL